MGRLRVLSASGAFWLLACGGELGDYPPSTCDLAEPPAEFSNEPLSIATFWADSYEQKAFEKLRGRIDSDRYIVSTEQNSTRVEVQRRIADGQRLPDVFQANGGSDVLRWVQHRSAEDTNVCALDRLRDTSGWNGAYFPAALAPLSCRGRLYGLPVGIHRVNVLFYNRDLFATLAARARVGGVELTDPSELKSIDELLAQLAQVAELAATTPSGKALVPLAIGTESQWPLTVIAFENVLLSLGHQAYETLWLGGLADAEPAQRSELQATLAKMLSALRDLRGYSDVSASVTWQDAVRQVGDGEALMTITGDWGFAQLNEKVAAGVATTAFPGTAGTFVYTPDSFAVPRELHKNGFPARSFLDIVESTSALIDFSNVKHSIPPRQDLSLTEIDALSSESLRASYREFASCNGSTSGCNLLLAVSGLAPPPGSDPCFDEMDAVLTYAVTGHAPASNGSTLRLCEKPFPITSARAESRLIELLLSVAEQRFAADCR